MKKVLSVIVTVTLLLSLFTTTPVTVSAATADNGTAVAAAFDEAEQSVGASSGTTGDCTWTLDDEGTLTISGNGVMGDYPYSLGPWGDSIQSVVIEDGVTSIGRSAFFYCTGLTSVTIPNSVTSIGECAFYGCYDLTSITISDSVTSIGDLAFSRCRNLKSVSVGSGNSVYDSRSNCNAIIRTATNTMVFGCRTTVIPDSVTNIGEDAFAGCCRLTSVTIPDSVTSIGDHAFAYCDDLTSVTIPDSVTSIGASAFFDCTGLTSVTIPGSVTSISDNAFDGCRRLTSVTLGHGVKRIGYRAFFDCRELTNVTIPDSVTNIGEDAFEGCRRLTSVTIPDSVTSIGDDAFYSTAWYNQQPNGLVYAGKVAYKYKGTMPSNTTITLQDGTKGIADGAFESCYNLTSITIPDSVTNIGDYAFGVCRGLTSVIIPNSVTSIGNQAFGYCTGLTSIIIPDSVTRIGYSAFSDCSGLISVTISNSVTRIDECTFEGCDKLTNVTIPDSVTTIGNYAFIKCWDLTSVNIPGSVTWIGSYAFKECWDLTSVTIPDSVTWIGSEAFRDCTGLTSIIIPDSVTSIGNDAFRGCYSLSIYGYKYTYAEEYALNHNIPFVAISDENTFIQKHLDFIGSENANNTYHTQLQYFDLAEIALEDYGALSDNYEFWRTIRGEIFDNPYYTVLADLILSESAAQSQMKSFDIHLDTEWKFVASSVVGLIGSKVDLTSSQKSKITNMFKTGDFSDETTFQLCQDVLGNKVSKDELNSMFNAYDKTNTFLDIFNNVADIVESVYDTMNYSAIFKAYEKTSDEFKVVLMQMAEACQMDNPWLFAAIEKYLQSDYDTEMRNKIVGEVVKNGINIGKTLFESSIESSVKTFLFNNMDLSKIGTGVASSICSFIEGCKIGYAIGTTIDNILFSTDDVADSYVAAFATAKTAGYLKDVLKTNEANLRNDPTIRNTVLFCETYNMLKNIQLNTADTMIRYFSKNQTTLINSIVRSNNASYELQIYNWQILKLNWQNASCHKGCILNSKLKNVTVACPVDVTVYANTGEIALRITDNVVQQNNEEVIATVCNNIKYITLPDDSYSIKITATENGMMTYSITDYDAFDRSSKTTCFDGISISKGNEYTGSIVSGSAYSQNDITLHYNNEAVNSLVSEYTNEELIKVASINLSAVSLSLKSKEIKTITAAVEPGNASNKTVTWYSDNPQIAQVDEYGNVTGVSAGKTKIYCLSLEGNVVAECEISVESRYHIGDTNLDGYITISDVTAVQQHLAELTRFTDEQIALADTNGDGEINISDATHLQMYLAEYDVVLGKQS